MKIFKKPWRMAAGFLFGLVLALAGFILQILCGPVVWDSLSSPANIAILAVLVAFLVLARLMRSKVGFFSWLASPAAAVPSIAWTLGLTVVMGLTAQIPERGWLGNMVTFWPFVLEYSWMTVIVGLVVLNHLGKMFRSWRELSASLNHLGLFMTLVCATLGSADKKTLEMTLREGSAETVAFKEDGTRVETGLMVHLNDFIMETYPSGMPKRFASDVVVRTKSGKEVAAVIDVNKPLKVDGWKMYQYDYDSEAGTESEISVLQLVKDPWLPFVYIGIYMMLAGALLMMVVGFNKRETL